MQYHDEDTLPRTARVLAQLLRAASPGGLFGAATPGPLLLAVPASDPRVTAVMTSISARSSADQAALRSRYQSDYGLPQAGDGFVTPWAGITAEDIGAVLAVSDALGVPPARVLALWMHEGKVAWNAEFHPSSSFKAGYGKSRDLMAPIPCAGVLSNRRPKPDWVTHNDFPRLRLWALAAVLACCFGLDYLMRRDLSDDQINLVVEDDRPNRIVKQSFLDGADELIQHATTNGWPVLASPTTADQLLTYFSAIGGALAVDVTSASTFVFAIALDSVPSWLVLQSGLFDMYRQNFENRLGVGGSLDPWVTYWAFNAGVEAVATSLLGGGAPTEAEVMDRIANVFDPTAPGFTRPVPPAAGESGVAVGKRNAIVHKFLVESVEPFFVPVPAGTP